MPRIADLVNVSIEATSTGRLYSDDITFDSAPLAHSSADALALGHRLAESAIAHAQRTATCDVARGIHVLGADAATATACQCGSRPVHVTDSCRALVVPIVPEPTPEQRATRTLPPITVKVEPWATDPETVASEVARHFSEILGKSVSPDDGAVRAVASELAQLRQQADNLLESFTLGRVPYSAPVVDFGTNPTREQLRAAGFNGDSTEYRDAMAKLNEIRASRKPVRIETKLRDPVTCEHLFNHGRCLFCLTPTGHFEPMPLPTPQTVGVARPIGLVPANRPTDSNTTCPAALGYGSSMHTYIPGAERCFCGKYTPPPYAVGDEVDWRTGPLDDCWRQGRVTSVIDDRPDDGIDKPCWRVCVDTATPRSFLSPAVIATCLRPAAG